MKSVKVLVIQLCLTLYDHINCSPPGSSVHGISQVRILEWVAIPFTRGSSWPGIELWSPALQADSLPSEPPGKLLLCFFSPQNTLGLNHVSPSYSSPHAQRFFTVRIDLNDWSIWSTLKVEVTEEEKPWLITTHHPPPVGGLLNVLSFNDLMCKMGITATNYFTMFCEDLRWSILKWMKSYNNTRQSIKRQRHHFANKGLHRHSYGFSSKHVWMWEMDHLEGWVPKNCCFWTVVLEKTPESPLDCKEIKPVNSKGNQSWIFIGKMNAEAPILWPPHLKSQLIGKDPDAGKDWEQEKKGTTEDEMVGWHIQLNGDEFEQTLGEFHGQRSLVVYSPWITKSRTWLSN